jgi:hypothetical protein
MKDFRLIVSICIASILLVLGSCKNENTNEEYVKKIQLKSETIAVGIYKSTGIKSLNLNYISEAIKIDAGMVYVTLTDAEILKTKLENIDVLIIPGLDIDAEILALDDEIESILKNFIRANGKGIIALSNGGKFIACSQKESLNFANVEINEKQLTTKGLINFSLTKDGESIFPELIGFDKLYTYYNGNTILEMGGDSTKNKVIAQIQVEDIVTPIIIESDCGLGKILFINTQFETTPGMRWVIPRMVRWSQSKPIDSYETNIIRPDLYNSSILINNQIDNEIKQLKLILTSGSKKEVLETIDKINNYYPWLFAENIRPYLIGRNDDLKLAAAEFLVNNEYTLAISDFDTAIKTERNKKNKELLREYKARLHQMIEQN